MTMNACFALSYLERFVIAHGTSEEVARKAS
jgi:hypothetical protein